MFIIGEGDGKEFRLPEETHRDPENGAGSPELGTGPVLMLQASRVDHPGAVRADRRPVPLAQSQASVRELCRTQPL